MTVDDEVLAAAVVSAVARACDVDAGSVHPETLLDELGLDSLGAAEVITDVEIRLDVEFPVDVLRGLTSARTVGEVLALLRDGLAVRG